MTHAEDVIYHRGEAGWLVLSSRVPELGGETPQFAEHLLQRMDLSRPAACLVLGTEEIPGLKTLLEGLEMLIGLRPTVLEATREPPAELARTTLVIMAGGTSPDWIRAIADSSLAELIPDALAEGAIVLATGSVAASVGNWVMADPEGALVPGLGWLVGALVLPSSADPAQMEPVRKHLEQEPESYALGLEEGALVAIGPKGEIEVWGESQPTIMLGGGWIRR